MKRSFLITGATKGIGLALAHRLAASGHTVIGIARNLTDDFLGTLCPLDMASETAAGALADIVTRHAVDGVVNNVGLVRPQPLGAVDLRGAGGGDAAQPSSGADGGPGGFSMISHTHLGCSSARNKGICGNRLTIGRVKLEEAVLGALRDHLMDPDLCAIFCEEYTRHVNRLRLEHNAALGGYKRELESATRELDKLIDAIVVGVPASRVKDRMHVLETRRAEPAVMVESTNEAPTLLHPNMAKHYRDEIQNLIVCLNGEDQRTEAAELMRSLIDKIVLTPNGMRTALTIDLLGDLAGILALANDKWANPKGKLAVANGFQEFAEISQDKMVAGARSHRELTLPPITV